MSDYKDLYQELKNNCSKCFGFCCVALYFSKSEGFPTDKEAGKMCNNLAHDFKCKVHNDLSKKGLKGCIAYDCFGAGQKVAEITYKNKSWREDTENKEKMFDVFIVMRQIHEMLWYLLEGYRLTKDEILKNKIEALIKETENITQLDEYSLLKFDLILHRYKVNILIRECSEYIRSKIRNGQKSTFVKKKRIAGRLNLIGLDLRKNNLKGEDFRGALLIASNFRDADLTGTDFIGADMRDTDLRGADLSHSIFLTQGQINGAKGDKNTKLPITIVTPSSWR